MRPFGELVQQLQGLEPTPFSGIVCRFVGLHHFVEKRSDGRLGLKRGSKALSGIGAQFGGARFTPKGSFETLYLAEDPITALFEINALQKHPSGEFAATKIWPMIYISAGTKANMLDITESQEGARAVEALGTSLQEITGDWETDNHRNHESPTQTLGRACFDSGRFQGIRYPSSKNRGNKGSCVAIFPDKLHAPGSVELFDPYGTMIQRIPSPQ